MSSVGVYEAKATLSKLLREVRKGRRITITRDRVPIADLVPQMPVELRPRLLAAGKHPSSKLVAMARKHVDRMNRRRGKPALDLETFIEDARADL